MDDKRRIALDRAYALLMDDGADVYDAERAEVLVMLARELRLSDTRDGAAAAARTNATAVDALLSAALDYVATLEDERE